MPLRVICFSTYRTSVEGGWRPVDHDAHKFIDAIKDRNLNGYAYAWLRGRWHRFDNANRQRVVEWFGLMVSDHFAHEALPGAVRLVPVPGSKVHLRVETRHRTAQLADAIAEAMPGVAHVADVLRWSQPLPSANDEGGPRRPELLYPHLHLTGTVRHQKVVLVDDVLTSGGHLQACAARLHAAGARTVLAVVAGRADDAQVVDPFAARVEELADFQPV